MARLLHGSLHPFSLKKHEHIRTSREFSQVFKHGKRWKFKGFLVCFMKNGLDYSRIGLSAGKRIGGAVKRNRVKRRIRELFRLKKALFRTGFDMVFMPDATLASMKWEQVEREFNRLLSRLAGKKHVWSA